MSDAPTGQPAGEPLRPANPRLVARVAELEGICRQREQLLGLIVATHEQERHRIADTIHDDALQSIVAVGMMIGTLRHQVQEPEALEALGRLEAIAMVAAERLRSVLVGLRSPERGLKPSSHAP